ncbi:MAG: hypothetical protein V1927_05785 [Candidatus Omnitrophota bacterium]
MARIGTFLFIAMLGMAVVMPCYCESDSGSGELVTLEGRITAMDWVAGVITMKWLQSEPVIAYDEITLSVPRDIKIIKGSQTIGFSELNQFDNVTVQYKKNGSIGLPKVVSLTVKTLGNS